MRFPMNMDLMPETINGVSVITFDETATKQKLHDFLLKTSRRNKPGDGFDRPPFIMAGRKPAGLKALLSGRRF